MAVAIVPLTKTVTIRHIHRKRKNVAIGYTAMDNGGVISDEEKPEMKKVVLTLGLAMMVTPISAGAGDLRGQVEYEQAAYAWRHLPEKGDIVIQQPALSGYWPHFGVYVIETGNSFHELEPGDLVQVISKPDLVFSLTLKGATSPIGHFRVSRISDVIMVLANSYSQQQADAAALKRAGASALPDK